MPAACHARNPALRAFCGHDRITASFVVQRSNLFHVKNWQESLLQSGSIEHLSDFDGVAVPC